MKFLSTIGVILVIMFIIKALGGIGTAIYFGLLILGLLKIGTYIIEKINSKRNK